MFIPSTESTFGIIMSELYKFELKSLSEHEMSELRKLKDIRFLREVPNTVPLTGAVDSFGNEIIPKKNEYDVLVEVIPHSPGRDSQVISYLTSLTPSGRDHGTDLHSKEYQYLKENLGLTDHTND